MSNWNFIPDKPAAATMAVPYMEEANGTSAPNYSTKKTIDQAKADVSDGLGRLGGGILAFQGGTYKIDGKERHGFIIRFTLDVEPFNGAEGVYRVVGLPIKSKTPSADVLRRVRVQALLTVATWLESAYLARMFSPDAHPLVPYLLVPGADGQIYTVTEAVTQMIQRKRPEIGSGS